MEYLNNMYFKVHCIRNLIDPIQVMEFNRPDTKGNITGKDQDYLKKFPEKQGTVIYLCESTRMIPDVQDISISQGFSHDDIKTEVHF